MNNERVFPTNVIQSQPKKRAETHRMTKREQKGLTIREIFKRKGMIAGEFDKRAAWEQTQSMISPEKAAKDELKISNKAEMPRIDVTE